MINENGQLSCGSHLKKSTIFKLQLISIFNPIYLKALMTLSGILDVMGPLLL